MEAHSLIFQWTVKKRYGPGNATTDNALVGLMWMKRLYFFVLFLKRSKHLLGRNSVSQTSHYVAQVRHGTTARIRFCMFDFSCSTATTKWLLQQIILLAPQSLLKGVWHWLWFSVPRMTAAKMTRRRRATTAPILLDIFASIAMLKDVDGTRSKFVFFEASVGNAAARIIVFFLELKCCFDGILLVVFWTIFVKSTNLRITVKIDLMSWHCTCHQRNIERQGTKVIYVRAGNRYGRKSSVSFILRIISKLIGL